jgi:glycosyltransferase involved in cell wall biosynthesis
MNNELPLINILIRTSNRPKAFLKCLDSVVKQDYRPIRIIIGYDNDAALRYIPKGLETVFVSANRDLPFFYDEYIPQLMALVDDGFILVADDDDVLMPNILSQLPLTGNGLVVQLQRYNTIVPTDLNFRNGSIGFPCLILHHSLKNIYKIHGNGQADSHFIRAVLKQVEIPFVPVVVVYSPMRGHGKCNG